MLINHVPLMPTSFSLPSSPFPQVPPPFSIPPLPPPPPPPPMSTPMTLSIKAFYARRYCRFSLAPPLTFSSLEIQLRTCFSLDTAFTIIYRDDESDLISVSTDPEFAELIHFATTYSLNPLRLYVYPADGTLQRGLSPKEVRRCAVQKGGTGGGLRKDGGNMRSIVMGGLRELIVEENGNGRGWLGCGALFEKRGGRGGVGVLGVVLRVMAMFCAGFEGVGGGVRARFGEFVHVVGGMKMKDRGQMEQVGRVVISEMKEWVRNGGVGNWEQVVERIAGGIEGIVGRRRVGVVESVRGLFLEIGKDEATVRLLKSVCWDGVETYRKGVEGVALFMTHEGVSCNRCRMQPVVGSRFKCVNRSNYDLCESCYLSRRTEGDLEFRECRYIWEWDYPSEMEVPGAPLGIGNVGVGVAFLQKVLTDVGCMEEWMYRDGVGRFGEFTKEGVLKFQSKCGIEISQTTIGGVYDVETANRLAGEIEKRKIQNEGGEGGEEAEEVGGRAVRHGEGEERGAISSSEGSLSASSSASSLSSSHSSSKGEGESTFEALPASREGDEVGVGGVGGVGEGTVVAV